MSQPASFEVPDQELQQIWRDEIRPDLFDDVEYRADPIAVFVGAQPGAGKSHAIWRIQADLADRTFVALDSDELRKMHPRFDEIMRADPLRMPVHTNQAAAAWFQMALAEARHRRLDVIVENSFHQPSVVADEAARFKEAGYQTHAIAIAVAGRDSRLGAVLRYLNARATGGDARWTNLASHQSGYDGVPSTVEALEQSPAVDRVSIVDRAGTLLYDASHGRPMKTGRQILEAARSQLPTAGQAEDWLLQYRQVQQEMDQIDDIDVAYTRPMLERLAADAAHLDPDTRQAADLHQQSFSTGAKSAPHPKIDTRQQDPTRIRPREPPGR